MLQLPPNFFRDLERSTQEDGRAFERESMKFAERLKRQGRDVVANYLSDATKANDLTPAARDSLAKFLAEYGAVDNLRDAGARRLRDAIVHIEAIIDLIPSPKSSWRRRTFAVAPWAIIGGAIIAGAYEPLRDASIVFCRFVARDALGTLFEYEFRRLLIEPTLPPTVLIGVAFIVCIFAGWRAFFVNAALAAVIVVGVNFYAVFANAREWDVPAYCSTIDAKTNATIWPTPEQKLRIPNAYPR